MDALFPQGTRPRSPSRRQSSLRAWSTESASSSTTRRPLDHIKSTAEQKDPTSRSSTTIARRWRRTAGDHLERYSSTSRRRWSASGSVGTPCFVIVLEGRDEGDLLILQAKEASASVLAPIYPSSHFANNGERIVIGQRAMQTTPDIFLGWTRGQGGSRLLLPPALGHEGLGRRSRRRHPMGSPSCRDLRLGVGRGPRADRGCRGHRWLSRFRRCVRRRLADFAEAYADQNQTDYVAFKDAMASGRLKAAPSITG